MPLHNSGFFLGFPNRAQERRLVTEFLSHQ